MQASERLEYRPFTEEDEALSVSMSMNEEIMKYITGKALNLADATDRFQYQLESNRASPHIGFFKALEKSSGEVAGYLKIARENSSTLEIGYAVLPHFRGKGFASEMTRSMITHCHRIFPDVSRLLGKVDKENHSSSHILQKHGFHLENEYHSQGKTTLNYLLNLSRQ